jgi:hypothetical protein
MFCFRCQPELGGDHEGAGAGKTLDYELSYNSSEVVNHEPVAEILAFKLSRSGSVL